MKKRSIRLIIGLMSVALLGVMAMQFYFLRQSYQMQSDLFDQSVNEALNNVASKVAKQDALNFLNNKAQSRFEHINDFDIKRNARTVQIETRESRLQQDSPISIISSIKIKKRLTPRERKLVILRDSLRRMIMHKKQEEEMAGINQEGSFDFRIRIEEFTDEFGQVHDRVIPEMVKRIQPPPMLKRKLKVQKYDTLHYVYIDPQFGRQIIAVPQINPVWKHEQERARKEKQMLQVKKMLEVDSIKNLSEQTANVTTQKSKKVTVLENLAEEYRKSDEPLNKRVNRYWIDSILRGELHNKGIYLPFSYEVLTAYGDSLIFSNALNTQDKSNFIETSAGTYQIPIFGNEVINDPGKLKIFFPEKNSLILGRMAASMGTTAGLLLVLVFCFGYTIFSILKQKKISEMKIDFINNMTHEFKTPVSTIMIASEALKDAEIVEDKSRVSRLANIIYEENVRLGSHIERVLNIARIEKDDFKLEASKLDANEMITVVLDSMALKLQKCDAQTTLNLEATKPVIIADELHFSNVLYNLIDNAIKYSKDAPEITISTLNRGDNIIIKVADKGIGMSRDQQAKIFEQFYRIPTGNLHDVKGFGLGLSYVNTIVKKLNGTVSVRSEKEKGSEFELKFPLA